MNSYSMRLVEVVSTDGLGPTAYRKLYDQSGTEVVPDKGCDLSPPKRVPDEVKQREGTRFQYSYRTWNLTPSEEGRYLTRTITFDPEFDLAVALTGASAKLKKELSGIRINGSIARATSGKIIVEVPIGNPHGVCATIPGQAWTEARVAGRKGRSHSRSWRNARVSPRPPRGNAKLHFRDGRVYPHNFDGGGHPLISDDGRLDGIATVDALRLGSDDEVKVELCGRTLLRLLEAMGGPKTSITLTVPARKDYPIEVRTPHGVGAIQASEIMALAENSSIRP